MYLCAYNKNESDTVFLQYEIFFFIFTVSCWCNNIDACRCNMKVLEAMFTKLKQNLLEKPRTYRRVFSKSINKSHMCCQSVSICDTSSVFEGFGNFSVQRKGHHPRNIILLCFITLKNPSNCVNNPNLSVAHVIQHSNHRGETLLISLKKLMSNF